jgi:hypothetical protein
MSPVLLIFLLLNIGRALADDMSVDRWQRLLPVRLRMEDILVGHGRESDGRGLSPTVAGCRRMNSSFYDAPDHTVVPRANNDIHR